MTIFNLNRLRGGVQMRWYAAALMSIMLCCLLSACSMAELQRGRTLVQLSQFQFPDGGKAIYYQLEKKPWRQQDGDAPLANLIFVISGSDCVSMGEFLPQYFSGLEGESGRTRILILHKRYILPGSNGQACGDAFVRADHPSCWQADQLEFMRVQLANLKRQGITPKRVIVLGVSEGAELAPVLAQQIQATHLVLLSHSGKNALDAYRALATHYPAMQQGWQTLQTALLIVPADPDATRIHGRSWRYWSEIAAIPQTQNLLHAGIPVFLAVGEADPVIPPGAVDDLQQAFKLAGRQIHISRFPGVGHSLGGKDVNRLPDFMHQVDNWLAETDVHQTSMQ
ncbi:alpha/beta hydrolase family protein [Undibacterium sp. Ji49W]|uniref:alpha/beta hydrolase family protein n=1 Tax=Undibacterium sp. Ji49W TaxID=3413040 RepID=UPI003BF3EB68